MLAWQRIFADEDEPPELHEFLKRNQLITSVTPLLSLYTEVDPGDYLPPVLEDIIEYLEKDDLVEVNLPGALHPYYGQITRVNVECQQALVDCNDGAQRWASIDELTLILKGSALEIETPSAEFESAS